MNSYPRSRPIRPATFAALPLAIALMMVSAGFVAAQGSPSVAAPSTTATPPGHLLDWAHLERWSAGDVQRRAANVFGVYGPPIVENAVDLWRLRFLTTGVDGAPVVVAAQAWTPVDAPRGAAPLMVYGSGTTGLGAACAPSRETLRATPLGAYRELLAPFAGRGVAVILPDYQGFDDPARPQAYFVAESEARVMLDAARAAAELYARAAVAGELRDHVVVAGYSQGGHAAFAAADHRAAYAPELQLRGIVGYAATTDVEALLNTAAYYAPYVLLAYRDRYGPAIDPAQVLAPAYLADLEEVAGSACVDVAQQRYPYEGARAYTPAFHRALQAGRPEDVAPAFARALDANASGLSGHGVPALLIQGGQDVIVRDVTQEAFVQALCAAGGTVQYVNVPTARHRDTRPAGFEITLAWLWSAVAGAPPASTCPP